MTVVNFQQTKVGYIQSPEQEMYKWGKYSYEHICLVWSFVCSWRTFRIRQSHVWKLKMLKYAFGWKHGMRLSKKYFSWTEAEYWLISDFSHITFCVGAENFEIYSPSIYCEVIDWQPKWSVTLFCFGLMIKIQNKM